MRRPANSLMDALYAAAIFVRAGYVRPIRPDRGLLALLGLVRWRLTPAAAAVSNAALYGGQTAVIDELGTLTFAELDERTNRLANAWADAGICSGDGVGIMCRNHRGFVEACIAASKLGAHALLLNTSFAGPQLTEVVKREKPRALVFDEEFCELIHDASRRRKRFIAWHDDPGALSDPTLEQLIDGGDPTPPLPPERAGRFVILTSGTTGTPEGRLSQPTADSRAAGRDPLPDSAVRA